MRRLGSALELNIYIASGERSLSKGGDVDATRFAEAQLGKSAGPPREAGMGPGSIVDAAQVRRRLEGWTPGKEDVGLTAGCAADAAQGRRQYEEARAMLSNTSGPAQVVATVREQAERFYKINERLRDVLTAGEDTGQAEPEMKRAVAPSESGAEAALLQEIALLATWADRLEHTVSVVERLVKLIR